MMAAVEKMVNFADLFKTVFIWLIVGLVSAFHKSNIYSMCVILEKYAIEIERQCHQF